MVSKVGFGVDGFGEDEYGSGVLASGYNAGGFGSSGYGKTYQRVDELTRRFLSGLPSFYVTATESGNYNLMWAAAHGVDTAALTLDNVDFATAVDTATTLDQLQLLGRLVNTAPKEDESLDSYRARLKAEYAVVTSEATIQDVLSATANIIGIDVTALTYTEPAAGGNENGTIGIDIPKRAFENSVLTGEELGEFIERLAPASYSLISFQTGTFTYITPTEYNLQNFDATAGYDGLDGNGDPTEVGGTYGGLI